MSSGSAKTSLSSSNHGPLADAILAVLERSLPPALAATLLMVARRRAGCPSGPLELAKLRSVIQLLQDSLSTYVSDPERRRVCRDALAALSNGPAASKPTGPLSVTVPIRSEADLQSVTDAAKRCARELGMSLLDQTKMMTATAELARNILQYAASGEIRYGLLEKPRKGVVVIATDTGPGIPDIARVMTPGYVSRTGMGIGLQGAKRLMDEFDIESVPGRGTTVTLRKYV
jgi:serine/threonine-protein kinase RsbT